MTAALPFVAGLRTGGRALRVGDGVGEMLTLRVEMTEGWNVVRIDTTAATSVEAVKLAALGEFLPGANPAQYVVKLRGFEVRDETATLHEAGAVNGSIFLVHSRRRRPVK